MSSATTETLVLIARHILIYGGLTMMAFGMFGSLMVIAIFSRRPFNQNPCSIYMITNGVLSFLFLPLYYLPNIVTFGFQINWLAFNTPFCKFQMSYGIFTVTSVFIINCFIFFDRYAMSSRSVRVRSLSSKKTARILVSIGLFVSWFTIGMSAVILFENITLAPGVTSCTSKSIIYLQVAAFVYYPILEGILPIVLAIYFWYVTRKHIRHLNNREFIRRFDQQISRMYFFQILANAIASFPFAAINLYRSLTIQAVRTQNQEDLIQFIRLLAIWIFYIQYCTDFYIYALTSAEIRAQAKQILGCCWRQRVGILLDQQIAQTITT